MTDTCVKLGLKQCPACAYGSTTILPNQYLNYSECWVVCYERQIKSYNDETIIKKFHENRKPNKHGFFLDNWAYYYNGTIMKLFPEKIHLIEKLLILL